MLEDRQFEIGQRLAGIETELVAEHARGVGERAKRLGLPTGSVEGERQPGMHAFAKGMVGGEHPQFADDQLMVPEREIGIETVLERGETAFLERRRLVDRGTVVGEVDEGRATPHLQCFCQVVPRVPRSARCQLLATGVGEGVESVGVHQIRRHLEPVSAVFEHELSSVDRAEEPTQSGHIALQGAGRRRRWPIGPQQLDQRVRADRPATRGDECSEHESWLTATDVHRAALVVDDLQRPEHPEAHRSKSYCSAPDA